MSDVTIEFRGDKRPFDAVRDSVRADARDLARTPIVPGSGATGDPKAAAKSFRDAYASAFDDLGNRATRLQNTVGEMARARYNATAGAGPFKFFEAGASAAEKQAETFQNRLDEIYLTLGKAQPGTNQFERARASLRAYEIELAQYEAQLAAVAGEELAAGSAATAAGAERRAGGLLQGGQLRGIGPVFRAAGLYQYGIDETTINAASALGQKLGIIRSTTEATAKSAVIITEAEQAAYAASQAKAAAYATYAAEAGIATAEIEAEAVAAAATAVSFGVVASAILPLVAVGYIIYDITKQIRAEEEHRLALIEAANKGINAQLTYEKNITDELKRQRLEAQAGREVDSFKKDFGSQTIEDLQRRRGELEQLTKYAPTGSFNKDSGAFDILSPEQTARRKKQAEELLALDEEIYRRQHTQDVSFSNLGAAAIKDQQEAKDALEKSIEQGIAKARELTKQYKSAFEGLFITEAKGNPFAEQMANSAKATETLKDQLKGLPSDLQAIAFGMQKAANEGRLFELQLQNAFTVIDLRAQARRFTEATQQERIAAAQQQNSFLNQPGRSTNPDVVYAANAAARGASAYDLQERQRVLEEKLSAAARARTPEQQAAADKAVSDLAKTVDPNQISSLDRQQIGSAIERTATRAEQQEREGLETQKRLVSVLEKLEANEKGLLGNIQKTGKQALDIVFQDKTGKASATVSSPTPEDTDKEYDFAGFDIVGGSNL
jgi:hypothetical protein